MNDFFFDIIPNEELTLDKPFVDNTLEKLRKIKDYTEKTEKGYTNLKNEIEKYINIPLQSQSIGNLKTSIDNYINFLNNLNFDNNKNNNIQENINNSNNVKEKFINFYKEISIVCENQYFKMINEFNENSKKIINSIPEFSPPTTFINSSINNSDKISNNIEDLIEDQLYNEENKVSLYNNIYGNKDISLRKKDDNTNDFKCNLCGDSKAVNYCKCCNMSYCESCSVSIIQSGKKHNFIQINEAKIENEKEKNKFLTSFMNLIKDYIFKCNYIIKNEEINFVDQDTFKKFQYPSIQIENNIGFQKKFLEEINDVYKIIKEKIDKENSINKDKICELFKDSFNKNVFNLSNLYDYTDFYNDEKYVEGEEEEDENGEQKQINKFYYIIHIINKDKNEYDEFVKEDIKDTISSLLYADKDNLSILFNNKRIFIDNFIKSIKFSKSSPKEIRIKYPNIPKLYEYKLIIDGLICYECKIPRDNINYNYNFIIPNKSLNDKRGKEIYNPPYGWMGIGLNVLDKYDKCYDWLKIKDNKSEWAIAYYGFGKNLSSDKIKDQLYNIIIKNNLKQEDSIQMRCHYWDKRHKNKKIGVGIYMSPYVNEAEQLSGIIQFNKKKYKMVLMARVLIENIREPDDCRFWILNSKDIRIYRILVKEII